MKHSVRWSSCSLGCFLSLAVGAPASAASIAAGGCCFHNSRLPVELTLGRAKGCDAATQPSFFQGQTCQAVINQGIDGKGFQFATLRITSFEMTTNHPVFGNLVVSLDTSRPVVSELHGTAPGPTAPVIHTTRLHVIATSAMLPGVVLQSQGPPLEFISEPSDTWPPAQNTYTLPVPVVFENRANPGQAILTACPGAVSVGGFVAGIAPTIPTVSALGLLALVLALVIATLFILRRRPAGSSGR